MPKQKMTYEAAMSELESIVQQVENGEMDIDHLSERLVRAKELIAFCQKRLTEVDSEVQKIFGDHPNSETALPFGCDKPEV